MHSVHRVVRQVYIKNIDLPLGLYTIYRIHHIKGMMSLYVCYNTLRVLYQISNHQAGGRGDYKSDIARVGVL